MKIWKLFPYEQYALGDIEEWLNDLGSKGYQLKSLGPIAEFEFKAGKEIKYRVRYIPENRDCSGTVYWGDLYVYASEDVSHLPPVFSSVDIQAAAKTLTRPFVLFLLFSIAILQGIVNGAIELLEVGQTVWAVVAIIAGVLFLLSRINRCVAQIKIMKGIFPSKGFSKKYIKYFDYLSLTLMILLSIVVEFILSNNK